MMNLYRYLEKECKAGRLRSYWISFNYRVMTKKSPLAADCTNLKTPGWSMKGDNVYYLHAGYLPWYTAIELKLIEKEF